MENRPEYGKTYALTGTSEDKCIANGNTWAESEVHDHKTVKEIVSCKECGELIDSFSEEILRK